MEIIIQKLNELELLLKKQNYSLKEILTLEEASEYLQLSKSCLYKMTSNKEIPHYVPGGKKIYFKKEELDSWVLNSKVVAIDDIDSEIESYLSRTSKSICHD